MPPIPYGFVNYKGLEDEINLKNYKMGDTYATAFSKGLSLSNVKKINLADNRLNEEGTVSFIKSLNQYVQEIDLS